MPGGAGSKASNSAPADRVNLVVTDSANAIEIILRAFKIVPRMAARKDMLTFIASISEVYGEAVKIAFSEYDDLLPGPNT